jgi:hypothetical protein
MGIPPKNRKNSRAGVSPEAGVGRRKQLRSRPDNTSVISGEVIAVLLLATILIRAKMVALSETNLGDAE